MLACRLEPQWPDGGQTGAGAQSDDDVGLGSTFPLLDSATGRVFLYYLSARMLVAGHKQRRLGLAPQAIPSRSNS